MPWRDWSTSLFARDAVAVLDAVAASGATAASHVYATSMGGRVAQRLAAEHPDRVERLVLACTTPGGRHAVERGHDVRTALAQPDLAARRAALLDLMYTPAYAAAHGATSRLLGAPGHERRRRGAATCGSAPATTPGTCCPPSPHRRWCCTAATTGWRRSANAELLAGRIPGAELHVYDGMRHGFFDELRDQVGARVLSFLRDAARPGTAPPRSPGDRAVRLLRPRRARPATGPPRTPPGPGRRPSSTSARWAASWCTRSRSTSPPPAEPTTAR